MRSVYDYLPGLLKRTNPNKMSKYSPFFPADIELLQLKEQRRD